ncbi:inositol 1,4,5-triphosphate receptor associated 2 isoform X2 [Engraulis encrasicolus]|uniref:inositol 1,4,5-triphosphate receptor associated 2 isoform X2 n=1 Tax=Engraulis encrasicolus TaxID=184585 RepID=UPI002FCFB909
MSLKRQSSIAKPLPPPLPLDNTTPALSSEDDSEDEENALQEGLIASLNQLSILERLGPTSDEMTEGEVECAFSQLALAFRCDQYTLDQRLQAEEHARNKAEENMTLELQRGKEAIEALKVLCLDSERYKALQKLDLTLDILAGTMEQVARTAEVLGAVHQEAKVSRAVDVMLAHVENMRQRHDRHCAELEETRKLIGSSASCDQPLPELREEMEIRLRTNKDPGRFRLMRRISSSVITKETLCQEAKMRNEAEEKFTKRPSVLMQRSESEPQALAAMSKIEDEESVPVEDSCKHHDIPVEGAPEPEPAPSAPSPPPASCSPPPAVCKHDEVIPKMPIRPSAQRVLRKRQRSRTELEGFWSRGRRERQSDCTTGNSSPFAGLLGRQRLPVHWLYHCRWILTCVYLAILVSIVLLAMFFWFLRMPVLWM